MAESTRGPWDGCKPNPAMMHGSSGSSPTRVRTAADIRRAAKVAVIFEVPADDAYVTLVGRAVVKDSAPDVRRLWKAAYDAFFASETDKANAIFVEIAAERLSSGSAV